MVETQIPTSHESRAGAWDWIFRMLALLTPILFAALAYDQLTAGPQSVSGAPLIARSLIGFVSAPISVLVSALILWRVPGNSVGRLLLLYSIGFLGWQFSYDYGTPDFHIDRFLLFLVYWNGIAFPSMGVLMLVFPTGGLEPEFRKLAAGLWSLAAVGTILTVVSTPMPYALPQNTANPLLIPALRPLRVVALPLTNLLGLILFILGAVSMIRRYRRSTGHERQQIKWLVWAFGIVVASFTVWFIAHLPTSFVGIGWIDLPTYFFAATLPGIGIGAAILAHHLWDIDVVIRRTLVYGAVTGVLAAVYFGGVALLQSAFVAISGQQSPLAVVASTLAIAALFTPLRRRVQNVVDRRFFRRKYDADKTVDEFARAVRDEVDIDLLRGELVRVVEETMQPAHVSLWLRK